MHVAAHPTIHTSASYCMPSYAFCSAHSHIPLLAPMHPAMHLSMHPAIRAPMRPTAGTHTSYRAPIRMSHGTWPRIPPHGVACPIMHIFQTYAYAQFGTRLLVSILCTRLCPYSCTLISSDHPSTGSTNGALLWRSPNHAPTHPRLAR